jgi:hypothetical protein
VLGVFHNAPEILRSSHIQKLESLHKGLSLCLYERQGISLTVRGKFKDIANQMDNIHKQAASFYENLEADTLSGELRKSEGTYSITDLLDWTDYLRNSYRRE